MEERENAYGFWRRYDGYNGEVSVRWGTDENEGEATYRVHLTGFKGFLEDWEKLIADAKLFHAREISVAGDSIALSF
jgi:hypothetical protein